MKNKIKLIAVLFSCAVLAACASKSSSNKNSTVSGANEIAPGINGNTVIFSHTANQLINELNIIYFKFDSYELTEDSKKVLLEQIELIKKSGVYVAIEGHTDERGTPEYNITLGQKRASAVYNFLVSHGVDKTKLTTVSYGEESPLVLGHTEEAYSKNRRAVLVYVLK